MVLEPPRRSSYAAALSGEPNQERTAATPVNRSPARSSSTTAPQRSSNLQQQRGYNMEELDNPFFFNTSDSPNNILVSPPLQGSSNYGSWSNAMRIALEVKNKWCIVDGTVTSPEPEHIQYAAWRRCNLMGCSWIYKSVIHCCTI